MVCTYSCPIATPQHHRIARGPTLLRFGPVGELVSFVTRQPKVSAASGLPPTVTALRADIIGKRGAQNVPDVRGSTAAVTAYLAGRPFTDVTTPDGQLPEQLPPWL